VLLYLDAHRTATENNVVTGRSNRPGRPKLTAAQLADRRRAVSEAALTLFVSEGYDAVSIRRVADRARVTPKTLYSYFDSKLGLLLSLWSDIFADVFATLDQVGDDDEELAHHIDVCTAYVGYWIERPDHYRLVFMSGDVTQADVTTFIDGSDITERFARLTAPLARLGGEAEHASREHSELLICALHGIVHCHVTMTGHPWAPYGEIVDILVRSIVDQSR
jgi:AcrR family transcriptional regulator